MEEVSIDHIVHEHPLTLIQTDTFKDFCYGCGRYFWVETAYGCKNCGNKKFLHTDCAETPREIRHSMHTQHTLVQKLGDGSRSCVVCDYKIWKIGYFCTCSGCEFQIHLRCELGAGVKHVADEQICIQHPSHPQHQLILVKKKLSFNCDACGTVETGRSYVCVACQYWIHEDCAALPATMDYYHHPHSLSLAFYLPVEYTDFCDLCDVCRKYLPLCRWVYHCRRCRYVVHIKCALSPPNATATASGDDANADDDQGVIQFPVDNVHEELIKPFVIRKRGEMIIPCNDLDKYFFPLHHHQLSLISSSSSSISEINDDEDEKDDVELTCDACTVPIFNKEKHHQSPSSSPDYYNYMSCSECKYFLHMACFNLPPELPSHPLHESHDHKLILEACHKLGGIECSICNYYTNGHYYSCTKCDFKADIKCASLPATIKHVAHPHHHLHLKFESKKENDILRQGICGGCGFFIFDGMLYKCGSCNFIVCSNCALLPPVNKHIFERHPMPLRYDARINHPGDFYCDHCENKMAPKTWMYHCRDCDASFHPRCIDTTSGYCRNMKFGQQYNVSADLHPHPLTFRYLTTKLRCDVCHSRIYGDDDVNGCGFHCSSCNFFMCLQHCGVRRLGELLPIA